MKSYRASFLGRGAGVWLEQLVRVKCNQLRLRTHTCTQTSFNKPAFVWKFNTANTEIDSSYYARILKLKSSK